MTLGQNSALEYSSIFTLLSNTRPERLPLNQSASCLGLALPKGCCGERGEVLAKVILHVTGELLALFRKG